MGVCVSEPVRFVTDCFTITETAQFVVSPCLSQFTHLSIYGRPDIMKVFVQAKNESIVINDEIIVTVIDIGDDNVTLAIDAPSWIEVYEKEDVERSESMMISSTLNGVAAC